MSPKLKHDLSAAFGYTIVAFFLTGLAATVIAFVYIIIFNIYAAGYLLYFLIILGSAFIVFVISYVIVANQPIRHVEEDDDGY